MTRDEIPMLAEQLNSLAEVYGAKQLSQAAIRVWVDTLKEFPLSKVMGILIDWPKSNARMPTPNQCWQIINERAIDDREAKHASDKARFERESKEFVSNLRGRQITGAILAKLNTGPKDPKGWAKKILARQEQDPSTVTWLQLSYAREAMGLDIRTGLPPQRERVPGEDDEELAA